MLGGALSAVIRYHHVENRPKAGICVANHTSPIDVLVLACDNAYALVSIACGEFVREDFAQASVISFPKGWNLNNYFMTQILLVFFLACKNYFSNLICLFY